MIKGDEKITLELTPDQLHKIIIAFNLYADLDYKEIKNIAQRALKLHVDSNPESFKKPMSVED